MGLFGAVLRAPALGDREAREVHPPRGQGAQVPVRQPEGILASQERQDSTLGEVGVGGLGRSLAHEARDGRRISGVQLAVLHRQAVLVHDLVGEEPQPERDQLLHGTGRSSRLLRLGVGLQAERVRVVVLDTAPEGGGFLLFSLLLYSPLLSSRGGTCAHVTRLFGPGACCSAVFVNSRLFFGEPSIASRPSFAVAWELLQHRFDAPSRSVRHPVEERARVVRDASVLPLEPEQEQEQELLLVAHREDRRRAPEVVVVQGPEVGATALHRVVSAGGLHATRATG